MNGPLIVQSDKTVLLEVDHAQAAEARAALAPFAELERAPADPFVTRFFQAQRLPFEGRQP